MNRRTFAASVLGTLTCAARLTAIDPIKRPAGPSKMQLSLAAYSYRKYLDLKMPSMTLFDFVDAAAELPLDGVELTSYYFAEATDSYLDKLKAHCAKRKLAISGVPVRNDFCQRDDAKRAADVEHVKAWLARAARLGAPAVRVFAGTMEKGDDPAACRARVVAAMEECAAAGEKLGVAVALENHGGITATADGLLELVTAVKGKAFGVNVDTGNFKTADPYADVAKIAPYGVTVQIKTEVFPGGKRTDADLPRMVKVLKDANYHGPVALEYEADEEPTEAVPRFVKELRKLIG